MDIKKLSGPAKRLYKAGWRIHSISKKGPIKITKWVDPLTKEIKSQEHALTTQTHRDVFGKGEK